MIKNAFIYSAKGMSFSEFAPRPGLEPGTPSGYWFKSNSGTFCKWWIIAPLYLGDKGITD